MRLRLVLRHGLVALELDGPGSITENLSLQLVRERRGRELDRALGVLVLVLEPLGVV